MQEWIIPEFEKMLFDLNEGLHHVGLLPLGDYITGYEFFMNIVFIAVMAVGFNKIVVWSDWFEEREEFFYETLLKILIPLDMFIILLIALYFGEYAEILVVLIVFDITLIVAIRKEFAGVREWLDEKFGWLF